MTKIARSRKSVFCSKAYCKTWNSIHPTPGRKPYAYTVTKTIYILEILCFPKACSMQSKMSARQKRQVIEPRKP